MSRCIDAHVHIIPETALGSRYEPLETELFEYGYRKTYDGGFYAVPPYVRDSQFTADTLVRMMDVYGVDFAVIQQTPFSRQNEDVARAVEKYPDRLAGAMLLEPTEDWRGQMDYWYGRSLRSVKFEMRSHSHEFPFLRYGEPPLSEIFERAGELGMTVTIDPAPVDFDVYAPDALRESVASCPKTRFVICHMGYPAPIGTAELRRKWEKMISIAALPNCWLDVSAMPDFFDAEGWPYPTALELLGQVKKAVGIEKLLWGTDIPGTLNRATYPQMKELFFRAGLSEEELDFLFWRSAAAAYALPF